jgi:uncharacterized damage-inducible protein DinB
MTNRESFLQTWAMESATTLRVLNAIPEKNLTYKPDPKSRTGLELTAFVAVHAYVLLSLIETGELKAGESMPTPKTAKEAAGSFPATLPKLEKALKALDDKSWDQKTAKITAPDGKVLRSGSLGMMVWSSLFDLIHHRGQLSSYIRAMGGKVPSIYGPSADDPGSM